MSFQNWKPRNKVLFFLLSIFFIFLFIIAVVFFQWWTFLNTPLNKTGHPLVLEVRPGQSAYKVAYELERKSNLESPGFFVLLARFKDATRRIQVGTYSIPPSIKPAQLLDKMISGEVILHKFTIVDGWTFQYLMRKISQSSHLKHTLIDLSEDALKRKLGSENISLEGQFYPDTYLFHPGTKDIQILKKAHKKMQETLRKAWLERDESVPYKTLEEALIAASLIQKETHLPEEYARVSAVIKNRLAKKMPLQFDPSVIFGLGEKYTFPLTRKQLKIDTPYNSYLRRGLPPTPIAMVNSKALHAALHPEDSNILYFVANEEGGHTFSEHYSDHAKAVSRYRKSQMRRSKEKVQANP